MKKSRHAESARSLKSKILKKGNLMVEGVFLQLVGDAEACSVKIVCQGLVGEE